MPKERKSFPLRMDPDIYQAVEAWAADEFRSVNAQIEFLLRESLRKSGRLQRRSPQPEPEPPQDGQAD
ncbi:Arc family DNA-binding protein [Paenibacillus pasadenensis]|uniref:Arc family DNA-binding protein n=1 Tax=Paenibacillus pasadenensis TaxID=217090 RepID=UPI000408E11D|nr:Arc family DNA-binding protein [Paenibacillus pasadenensis]